MFLFSLSDIDRRITNELMGSLKLENIRNEAVKSQKTYHKNG